MIDEEDAVQVVCLMLERLGKKAVGAYSELVRLAVESRDPNPHRTLDDPVVMGKAQTSLRDLAHTLSVDDFGVDVDARLLILRHLESNDASERADLVRGQSDAAGVDKGVHQVVREAKDGLVYLQHAFRPLPQDAVWVFQYRDDRQDAFLGPSIAIRALRTHTEGTANDYSYRAREV